MQYINLYETPPGARTGLRPPELPPGKFPFLHPVSDYPVEF
jgi:hypothetical protein